MREPALYSRRGPVRICDLVRARDAAVYLEERRSMLGLALEGIETALDLEEGLALLFARKAGRAVRK